MNDQLREQITDFLRREIIGPDPIAGATQANGEEILVNDPPRLRYAAGVLFPQQLPAQTASEDAPEEDAIEPDENDVADASDDTSQETDDIDISGDGEEEDSDKNEDNDESVALTNTFLPSAIGISCVAEIPAGGLNIEVSCATYTQRNQTVTNTEGRTYDQKLFERRPLRNNVNVPQEALIGEGVLIPPFNVVDDSGETRPLCIRLLSRPCDESRPRLRLLTVTLVNTQESESGRVENDKCFFQVEMRLSADDGAAIFHEYRNVSPDPDEEEQSLQLLYRHRKTYGIGHGCAAGWDETDSELGRASRVFTEVMPVHILAPIVPREIEGLELSMHSLSDEGDDSLLEPALETLCARYEKWIAEQRKIADKPDFPDDYRNAANRHLRKCEECLKRMRAGVSLLREDATVRHAFQLANRAMLYQQRHYALGTTDEQRPWQYKNKKWQIDPLPEDWQERQKNKGVWRPFQLAFLLMNLRSFASPEHEERELVDLIWFPTGGGKTEAYLGLSAFAIILRRLRTPDDAGTAILMRYTLRLLTAQQFQRAASLICALEKMRREESIPGARISIGLWAGGGLTPNKREDAKSALNRDKMGKNPFVISNCPWCGAKMGMVEDGNQRRVLGYEEDRPAHLRVQTVVFRCHDTNCDFSYPNILPLSVIDEDLYDAPPTLLLGTVDKFAMLPWRSEAQAFFGNADTLPPDLIIQDELHLISGPLGSMVGHYETVISELCSREQDGLYIRPKIVASTATIARASEQCHSLWNCKEQNVFVFPPQALCAGDSFFAHEDENLPGRAYIGVHASALNSHVTAQVRVMSAMLQGVLSATVQKEKERDPYWTLIGYYNSLRELGHAATLFDTDIKDYLRSMWQRLGLQKPASDQLDKRRFIGKPRELTSRTDGAVSDELQQLFIAYKGGKDKERPVDAVLATNMISVGLDVPRLGLMTVAGQPKTTSEYIQATSRVGRAHPGMVIAIYNMGRPRDRSHYEHFHSYHAALYRAVEPASVTPFSAPVRERALHALLATLVRYWSAESRERPIPPDEELRERIERIIEERVAGVDPDEREKAIEEVRAKFNHWRRIQPPRYGDCNPVLKEELPLLNPSGTIPHKKWEKPVWQTLTSMRDVDASCNARVIDSYQRPSRDESNIKIIQEKNYE